MHGGSSYTRDPLARAERYVRRVFNLPPQQEESPVAKTPLRPADRLVLERFRELAKRYRSLAALKGGLNNGTTR